ncbi:GerAB/ArcD/ProY family transporter [Clostridium oryzae]|uniref:Spore germination protein YndE n=1 Tax=Clostridium oryzae TaxID=1450648 RepID=A0A1V4IDN2_9CLOT|nr:GerAB/ArcD/ProY family transporter [Clostridium oryzae]OPJ58102.1 spore germination protein YndE [Clostridium oryzae]
MVRLSKIQLFTLTFIFEIGSTTVFALGIEAKQDAWIVILIALCIGLIYTYIYTELQLAFPDKNYMEIMVILLGKGLGTALAILYPLNWFWNTSRNVREFGELVIVTTLPDTPLYVINFIFVAISVYMLTRGTETIARASELALPIVVFFIVGVYVLTFFSGNVDFKKLLPVLGEGIMPVLKAVPGIVFFPFGESFIFSMYWQYIDNKRDMRKTYILAIFLSGILLCCTLIMDITTLSAEYASIATIPFIESIRLINIANIITNIDAIGVIIIFLGGFFKMSIYFNGIVIMICTIFKIKNNKVVIILVGIILFLFSVYFEPSYAYHKWMFPFDANSFGLVQANGFPLLLLLIYWIKKRRRKFN